MVTITLTDKQMALLLTALRTAARAYDDYCGALADDPWSCKAFATQAQECRDLSAVLLAADTTEEQP